MDKLRKLCESIGTTLSSVFWIVIIWIVMLICWFTADPQSHLYGVIIILHIFVGILGFASILEDGDKALKPFPWQFLSIVFIAIMVGFGALGLFIITIARIVEGKWLSSVGNLVRTINDKINGTHGM